MAGVDNGLVLRNVTAKLGTMRDGKEGGCLFVKTDANKAVIQRFVEMESKTNLNVSMNWWWRIFIEELYLPRSGAGRRGTENRPSEGFCRRFRILCGQRNGTIAEDDQGREPV